MSNVSCPVQFYWISLFCPKYFAQDCRLTRICRIQSRCSFLLSSTGNTFFEQIWSHNLKINGDVHFCHFRRQIPFLSKFCPKNLNCQFNMKFGTKTNLNMQKSIWTYKSIHFWCFRSKILFLGKFSPKIDNYLKFGT